MAAGERIYSPSIRRMGFTASGLKNTAWCLAFSATTPLLKLSPKLPAISYPRYGIMRAKSHS
jgi:hypothetical protein